MIHDFHPISKTEEILMEEEMNDYCVVVSRLGSVSDWEKDAVAMAELIAEVARKR
jgi:hypothetical protein